MQNNEIVDLKNKRVKFIIFDKANKAFTDEQSLNRSNTYTVLWYDAKMKNYLMFLEYLHKKNFTIASVNAILIVDKQEYMQNIQKIID